MSTFTPYDTVIVTFKKGLDSVDNILTKAEEYAKEKGIDVDATYTGARLYEDMQPLTFQVETLTNNIVLAFNRVTGADHQGWDNSKTFADLHKRIVLAHELLASIDPETFNAKAQEVITFSLRTGPPLTMPAKDALFNLALPNFFFHITTAYAILRAQGVPLGKSDYLTPFKA